MLPTRLSQTLSALAIAVIVAGPIALTAAPSAAEKKAPAANSQKSKAAARIKARAAKAKAAKAKAAKAKAANAKAKRAAKAAKAAKAAEAKVKSKRLEAAKKPQMAKPQMAKPQMAKPQMAKPKAGQTQTALSAQSMTKLAKLARSIDEHMQAGEADGSLTKGEIARLASLKERVVIMDRMSRNDESFTDWERRYLETANTILRDIVRRQRLDGEMSVEPRHVEMRIQRGLQDGTLTEQQAENLRSIQRRILVYRNEADEDGTLSPKEKARYMAAQYKLSSLLNHTRRYGPVARTLGQSRFKETLERAVRNGSFSRREARALWRTHQRIHGLREQAIADGKITPLELTVLNRRLKAARHQLSYGEREAYRRSLRAQPGRRTRAALGGGGGSEAGDAARSGAAAVRDYSRSVGGGLRSLGRTFGR
ncbi:MAG TPA: hypothetical protein VM325_12520 [Alphaproteobacteria bacterium]|nr:hypothetical protein [Alphaproteobacteria bacterium]